MNFKDLKLVVCDIDGTLVTNQRELTTKTKEVINRLLGLGIYFGIASGRSIDQQLADQAKKWGFDQNFELLIGMNGAEMWDGINDIRHDYYLLKREWIKEIIELMEPFDLNPFIYADGKMMCKKLDDLTMTSSKNNKTSVIVAGDIAELYEKENAKIMFRISEDKIDDIISYVNNNKSEYYKAFKTQTTMLEFTDSRVSKAVALHEFCKANDITADQVMSFGDMTNDNELLAYSGFGVCLANGSEDTKAVADYVTTKTNDEEGFADFVINHVLT